MRWLRRLLLLLVIVAILLAAALKWRYGGGDAFPDRSGQALYPATALEKVADLPSPPGNIAVSESGRVFATLHPEARPEFKVIEIVDGQMQPWPSADWQDRAKESKAFIDVLSIRIDQQGRLWVLDNGQHGLHPARLLRFDLDSGLLEHEYTFPRTLAGYGSHLNDFQVSGDGSTIYIADASFFAQTPALLVYDVHQRKARRLLDGHPSVTAQRYTPVVQGRHMEVFGLVSIRPGVDSITLSRDGQWLYYAPITNLDLYRVRTSDLRNTRLTSAELSGRVQTYAAKTMSDGITSDRAGNIYLSDLEHSAIVLLRPDGSLQTLVQDQRLRWPDGFSFGPENWLYVTCSALHQVIGRLPGQVDAAGPYQIYRLRAPYPGVAGH